MTASECEPTYTRRHWAKAQPRDGYPKRIHLLEHHLADVGVCMEALLMQPAIRRSVASSAALDDLDDATASRLGVFAALHDIGKSNVGFQSRIWRQEDCAPHGPKPRYAGHTADLTPVLNGDDRQTADWFFAALGWWEKATETWDDRAGETVCALLVATLSHHGEPLPLADVRQANPRVWRSYASISPERFVRRVGEMTRRWFPAAFAPSAPPLPGAAEFQHMFLGLCMLADWIGSNEEWFPFVDQPCEGYIERAREQAAKAVRAVGLDLREQRDDFRRLGGFSDLFCLSSPNAIQRAAALETALEEPVVIIESETGSGKTEAVLWRFARMYEKGLVDGMYFALPTRAAASQMHGRVERFAGRLFPCHAPPVVRAVPGYHAGEGAERLSIGGYDLDAAGHGRAERSQVPWATENPKRFLAAQLAVGTVDQAMMAALQVRHAHMRAACLARNLLVIDEVHASDPYMRGILQALLASHVGAGGYALLMSATLGSAARAQWLAPSQSRRRAAPPLPLDAAIGASYPSIATRSSNGESNGERVVGVGENGQDKCVRIEARPSMGRPSEVARVALSAARAGAKTLIVRNTVGAAVQTQRALEELAGAEGADLLFSVNGTSTLHHGRFAACDRELLDKRVEELLGGGRRPGGRVIVGTQTLEQSLDIDADLLITDLCPMDVLLQRIGRLHRRQANDASRPADYAKPTCVVLSPPHDDLSPLLDKRRDDHANGIGPGGFVYPDLRVLELTRRRVAEYSESGKPWRIPQMNRKLVERTTHSEALKALVDEMGGKWKEHANDMEGARISDTLTAKMITVKRDKSFYSDNRDVVFADIEEKIRTRLGDDRVDVALSPPACSPFDGAGAIDKLAVSTRWLRGEIPEGAVEPTPTDGGFEFAVGERRFTYDRLGLQRVDD